MATTDNPLSAFMRGFQGAQDRAQKQEQQAIQNQLAEQLRGIQLMNAQQQAAQFPMQQALLAEQLRKARMTPEELAIEAARASNIQNLASQQGVIFTGAPPIEEITPQAQELLNLRQNAAQAGGLPFSREGISGINMQTAIPGLPGAVISPAQISRQQDQARLNAQLQRELQGPKTFTVGGNLLSVSPDNQVTSLFSAPSKLEEKTYTLSPGQTVFDSTGNQIASLPKDASTEKLINVAPGSVVIDATGKKVFENETGGKAGKPLPGDISFKTNVETFKESLKELEDTVKKYGNYEIINPDGSAKLNALPYQIAIQYSKIVDPESVAREGEVKAAQKYLIPLTTFNGLGIPLITRNKTTLAAIENMKKTIENYSKNRAASREQFTGQDLTESSGANNGKLIITEIP